MPVSHIGLTVSHLPTSCSFFLSALQPLGYRFIGQQGSQIGLGIHDADFFLCQETPGVKAGAAHIAFNAPSRSAVRDFYAAALTAGGRPNGAPASRTEEAGHLNAAVLDFDGNSIEVVFRDEPYVRDDGTVIEHNRVITWRKSVTESVRDDRTVVSSRSAQPAAPAASISPKAPSVVSAASTATKAASMMRTVSEPVTIPQITTSSSHVSGDGAAKKIIGTLLGAAAGAAVAYAMVKSEDDSAKKEAEFDAFQRTKALEATMGQIQSHAHALSQLKITMSDPQPICEAAPGSVHRDIYENGSHYSSSQAGGVRGQLAIEAAPPSYQSPSYTSAPPTQISERRAIEYAPAYSVAHTRSVVQPASYASSRSGLPSAAPTRLSAHRSVTSPELMTVMKARSTMSKVESAAPSAAPSTLISSFVPDQLPRRRSEESVHSHHTHRSSKSRAKSQLSNHTSASKHSSKSRSRAPSPSPPAPASSTTKSKVASVVGSILGRDTGSTASKKKDDEDFEIEELDLDDTDTVAPSDSISNAGSSSRRSHRSHRSSSSRHGGSTASKHSSASKHSKSSKHSHHSGSRRSHHSSHSRHGSASPPAARLSVISEPSDASTAKPLKPKSKSSERKDSMNDGQYDAMFGIVSLPVRGPEPSGKRSMMSYAMGQKMRNFEGQ